jgi:Tfp pilus assembly protein PilF
MNAKIVPTSSFPAACRWAAGTWSIVAILLLSGCSLFPKQNAVSFSEHRTQREDASSQRITDKRDHAEFLAAHQRWVQQDFQGCREQLENILARNPKHCDARLLMADVLLSSGKPNEALGQVQEALKYHADDPDVQYAMGLTLDANGRPDEALVYYERAAKATPGNEAYAMSYRSAGEAARQRKIHAAGGIDRNTASAARVAAPSRLSRPPEPAQSLETAAPISPVPQPGVATSAQDAAKQPTTPIAATGKSPAECRSVRFCSGTTPVASSTAPPTTPAAKDQSAVFFDKGRDALEHGSPRLASAWFRKAADCNPQNPQIPVAAGMLAIKHNDPKLAVDLLTPAAERMPDSAAVLRTLGMAHLRTGDFSASQKDLERAISLDKSNALSYFLMGCNLTKLGQLEAADANFRQAETLDSRYAVQREAASRSGL